MRFSALNMLIKVSFVLGAGLAGVCVPRGASQVQET